MSILFFNKLNAQYLNARDLIITKEGDSIRAKVTKKDENSLYFTFIYNDEVINTQLPVSDIKFYEKKFYIDNEALMPKESLPGYEDYKIFRAAFNTGFSYFKGRVEKGPDSEMLRELTGGTHFSVDLTYFFSKYLGVGLKYGLFSSTVYLRHFETFTYFSHPFVGPSFSTRISDSYEERSFIISLALGYMGYKSKTGSLKTTGNTVGFVFDVSYEIKLLKELSLGFQLSSISGSLSKFRVNGSKIELADGVRQGLGRVDLSIGFRFNK